MTEYETDLSMGSQTSGSRTSNANVESVESDRQSGTSDVDRRNTEDGSEMKGKQNDDKDKRKTAKNNSKKKRRANENRRNGKLNLKINFRGLFH